MAATKTAPALKQQLNMMIREQDLALRQRNLQMHEDLLKQDKVTVSVSPHYAPYFGSNMTVNLSGNTIQLPCNGNRYEIPKDFAALVYERIWRVDQNIKRQSQMADITKNIEAYPGQLAII